MNIEQTKYELSNLDYTGATMQTDDGRHFDKDTIMDAADEIHARFDELVRTGRNDIEEVWGTDEEHSDRDCLVVGLVLSEGTWWVED